MPTDDAGPSSQPPRKHTFAPREPIMLPSLLPLPVSAGTRFATHTAKPAPTAPADLALLLLVCGYDVRRGDVIEIRGVSSKWMPAPSSLPGDPMLHLLHSACERDLVATNPARLLRRARCAPPPPRALHGDEQKRLLEVLANAKGDEAARDRMLVELLLGTGMRIGSALAIDIGDLDFAHSEIAHSEIALRTTKNDRPCSAVMPPAIAKRLKAFVAGRTEGPVFLAGDHRVSMRHAQRRLSEWFAAAGIVGRSAHSLRHAYASSLLAKTWFNAA